MPKQTLMQAASLVYSPLPARLLRKAPQLCLILVLVSLEVKPKVRISMVRQDFLTTWKAGKLKNHEK